jgi:hypothetical protein
LMKRMRWTYMYGQTPAVSSSIAKTGPKMAVWGTGRTLPPFPLPWAGLW